MCQTLGYHRISTMAQDTELERDEKIALFWHVYMADRTVSLRLGRACTIQDYDISLPVPEKSLAFPDSFMPFLGYWIEVARIQGQAAERLYSPAAALLTQQERWRRANILSTSMERAFEGRLLFRESLDLEASSPEDQALHQWLINSGDTMVHYSTLTLIRYSAPPMESGTSPGLDPAREALRTMQELSEKQKLLNRMSLRSYFHWVTLNTPFTPFIVIFGHVIAHYQDSGQDLQLLRDFVGSLEHFSALSEGIDRFYQMCSVFYKVAEAYVFAKRRATEMQQSSEPLVAGQPYDPMLPTFEDIDECLAILNHSQYSPLGAGYGNADSADAVGEAQVSGYLYDWYSGNASLLGLMEHGFDNLQDPALDSENPFAL